MQDEAGLPPVRPGADIQVDIGGRQRELLEQRPGKAVFIMLSGVRDGQLDGGAAFM